MITHTQVVARIKSHGIKMPRCDCGWNNGDHAGHCELLRAYERIADQIEDELWAEEQENKAEYEMRLANEEADYREEYHGDFE